MDEDKNIDDGKEKDKRDNPKLNQIINMEEYKMENVIRTISRILYDPLMFYFIYDLTIPEIADSLNKELITVDATLLLGITILKDRLGIDKIDEETKQKIKAVWLKVIEQDMENLPSTEEVKGMYDPEEATMLVGNHSRKIKGEKGNEI